MIVTVVQTGTIGGVMSLVDETLRVEWTEETNTWSCNKNKDNISLVLSCQPRVTVTLLFVYDC